MLQLLFFTKFVSEKYSVCRVLRQRINWPANYERQLGNKPGPGIRAGIGYASSTGEFRVSVPVGINYLFDLSHERSFIETGVGVTWAEESIWKTGFQNSSSTYEPGFFASIVTGTRHLTA
jgi:hypothetical protein